MAKVTTVVSMAAFKVYPGWRTDDRFVFIGRGSKWGNPFVITKDCDRAAAIRSYEEWITAGDGRHLLSDLPELVGKVLVCYCKPAACHGDVLARLVAKPSSTASP